MTEEGPAARGRLFTERDGHTYVRPRLDPYEPGTPLGAQRALDSTTSRVRVHGLDALPATEGDGRRWVTLHGRFEAASIAAKSVETLAGPIVDHWSGHPSLPHSEDHIPPGGWRITPERNTYLTALMDKLGTVAGPGMVISSGMSGTRDGGHAANVAVLWVSEALHDWARDLDVNDLWIVPFIDRPA